MRARRGRCVDREGEATARVWRRVQPPFALAQCAGLIIAVALAFLASGAEAARWEREVVEVRDYTGGRRWGPLIERQVEALNAALPHGAPRFVYQDAGKRPCHELEERRVKGVIRVCSLERLSRPAAASTSRRKETIRAALIVLRHDQVRFGAHRVCHELMHATTAIPDAYHTEPQSCVRGPLTTFGAWDIALLAEEYG